MTTKKAKSIGKTVLWGVRKLGEWHPERWLSRKQPSEPVLWPNEFEHVRVTVEPVKKGNRAKK